MHNRQRKNKLPHHHQLGITTPEAERDLWFTNITLTCIVMENYRFLTKQKITSDNSNASTNLTDHLAFIYRFHQFILALKLLTKSGNHREALFNTRTRLVHSMNAKLFDSTLLTQTMEQLRQMDLSELDQLNTTTTSITGHTIFTAIRALPLFKAIYTEPDHNKTKLPSHEIEAWLLTTALPLFNHYSQPSLRFFKSQDFYAARKLLIMLIGDCCPEKIKPGFFSHETFDHFMELCRTLRNDFAHKALTKNLNNHESLNRLAKLARQLTNASMAPNDDLIKTISPFKHSSPLRQ